MKYNLKTFEEYTEDKSIEEMFIQIEESADLYIVENLDGFEVDEIMESITLKSVIKKLKEKFNKNTAKVDSFKKENGVDLTSKSFSI